MLCEKELLSKVAAGDKTAFAELLKANYHYLGAHIYRITKSAEDTEEIVQDIFLKIWINRAGLHNVQNFKAYLFSMSKNQALNFLKKMARERFHYQAVQQVWLAADYALENDKDSARYHWVDEAINHLPAQQQKVYLLSRHQRLKYHEIARQLDISRETVKKYLQIASVSITNYVQHRAHTDVLCFPLLYLLFKNL